MSTSSCLTSLCEVSVRSLAPGMAKQGWGALTEIWHQHPMAPAQAVFAFISPIHPFPQAVNWLRDFFWGATSKKLNQWCLLARVLAIVPRSRRTSDSPRAWQVETLLLHPPDPLLLVLGHCPRALPAPGEAERDFRVGPASWASLSRNSSNFAPLLLGGEQQFLNY